VSVEPEFFGPVLPLVNGTEEIGTGRSLNPSDLIANLRALLGLMKQIHKSTALLGFTEPSRRKLPHPMERQERRLLYEISPLV
jgi:hypothetical protein